MMQLNKDENVYRYALRGKKRRERDGEGKRGGERVKEVRDRDRENKEIWYAERERCAVSREKTER